MRLLTYMFILLTLIGILIEGVALITATAMMSKDALLREYELRRCGRFLALQKNLLASVDIIEHYHAGEFVRERLLAASNNLAANYKVERCLDKELGLMVEVYQHNNPMLPDFWANYAFRFVVY